MIDQNQDQEEEGIDGEEFDSDSGFREEDVDVDGEVYENEDDLSPTHEAFYPFPLPDKLNENEELPPNSMNFTQVSQIPSLNLEPPTPAKNQDQSQIQDEIESPIKANGIEIDNDNGNELNSSSVKKEIEIEKEESLSGAGTGTGTTKKQPGSSPLSSALLSSPPAPPAPPPIASISNENSRDEIMESIENEIIKQSMGSKEGIKSEEESMNPTSGITFNRHSTNKEEEVRSTHGNDDNMQLDSVTEKVSSEIDPPSSLEIKDENLANSSTIEKGNSRYPDNEIESKAEIQNLRDFSSTSGVREEEKEEESENYYSSRKPTRPSTTTFELNYDRKNYPSEEMDPDLWEVSKRPNQSQLEEFRRLNSLRDWDKECDELLGKEKAEKDRKQTSWQNQKSIRVRAEEQKELDREKGIFRGDDFRERRGGRGGVGGGRGGRIGRDHGYDDDDNSRGGRGRGGRGGREENPSRSGYGHSSREINHYGILGGGDSPPRFQTTASLIPPPSASYQPLPSSSSITTNNLGFSSTAISNPTSQFSTEDSKSKLLALQAQLSSQPDLFQNLLNSIGSSLSNPYPNQNNQSPYGDNNGNVRNHYDDSNRNGVQIPSYNQPPPPLTNYLHSQSSTSTSRIDPYSSSSTSRNDRSSIPPSSSYRQPDYRNEINPTTNRTQQDPYSRSRSPGSMIRSREFPYSTPSPSQFSAPPPSTNHNQYGSPSLNSFSDPYSINRGSNSNPYGSSDPYNRNPPPSQPQPPANPNGWHVPPPPSSSSTDPYANRGGGFQPDYSAPPPSSVPIPQVTGYGGGSSSASRSTNYDRPSGSVSGSGYGRYESERDWNGNHGGRGAEPYRGGGGGGRGGKGRESRTKRMMS